MRTICTALGTMASCATARWYLDRSSRRESEFCRGHVRLKSLWNTGAAFGLPLPRQVLITASSAALGAVCGVTLYRGKASVAAGLLIGGGLSNQLERLLHGRVYDYVQFPKAPGPLKRYVFNLADFAVFTGSAALLLSRKRR